jgi:hypothetical protein
MTREELAAASELLESAAEDANSDAASKRLADLADQLDTLSTADRGPDHGRLARIQSALDDIAGGDGSDVAEAIEDADDQINEYRSGLEGV